MTKKASPSDWFFQTLTHGTILQPKYWITKTHWMKKQKSQTEPWTPHPPDTRDSGEFSPYGNREWQPNHSFFIYLLYIIILRTAASDRHVSLYCQDKTRNRFSDPIREAALPDGGAMARRRRGSRRRRRGRDRRRGWRREVGVGETGDGEGRVEVLSDLGYYPISDRPGVDPGDWTAVIAALGENCRTERREGAWLEDKWLVGWDTSEQAHHKLVGRRAMEPPLEVGGEKSVDRVDVTWA